MKKLRPDVIRGILSTNNNENLKKQGKVKAFLIKNMALNFAVKPDFISYEYTGFPKILRKCRKKVKIAWTIIDNKTYQDIISYVDNIIFENFLPKSLEEKLK